MPHRISVPSTGPEFQIEAFNEPVRAHQGESVAAALLAAGRPVLSRSVKYHRPRGPFCLNGRCSHCLMRIDGVPNRFACRTECRPGMRVEAQNVFGSAQFDALSAIDFLFPRGLDHHEMFAGVPVVESVVAGVARHLAGLGTLPEKVEAAAPPAEVREVDLAVVGAGPAGLGAALAAAEGGLRVEVVDENPQPGGHLHCGLESLPELEATLSTLERKGVRFSLHTFALGAYRDAQGPFLGLRFVKPGEADGLAKLYARRFVLCPGGTETLPLFEGNDVPGVFAARGLMRLIRTQGVVPGERAAVLAEHAEGLQVAEALESVGCKVVAVVDPTGTLSHPTLPLVAGRVLKASGGKLSRIKVEVAGGKTRAFACDLLAVSGPVAPSFELARQMGLRADFRPGVGFLVASQTDGRTAAPGVAIAGEATGPASAQACLAQGLAAGRALAAVPEVKP
jgi:sarcosine oxidase subunit alpha